MFFVFSVHLFLKHFELFLLLKCYSPPPPIGNGIPYSKELFNFIIRISINIINNLKVKDVNNIKRSSYSYHFDILRAQKEWFSLTLKDVRPCIEQLPEIVLRTSHRMCSTPTPRANNIVQQLKTILRILSNVFNLKYNLLYILSKTFINIH